MIDDAGTGYAIGDSITFTDTNTNGGGATAKVSVVNGGITTEAGTVGATAVDHIVLEDETVRGDVYTGDKIVQESGSGNEDITDQHIDGFAKFYGTDTIVTMNSTDLDYWYVSEQDINILYTATKTNGDNYDLFFMCSIQFRVLNIRFMAFPRGTGGYQNKKIGLKRKGLTFLRRFNRNT